MAATVVPFDVSLRRCDHGYHAADRHRAAGLHGQDCPGWLLVGAHPENSDGEAQLLQLTADDSDLLAV